MLNSRSQNTKERDRNDSYQQATWRARCYSSLPHMLEASHLGGAVLAGEIHGRLGAPGPAGRNFRPRLFESAQHPRSGLAARAGSPGGVPGEVWIGKEVKAPSTWAMRRWALISPQISSGWICGRGFHPGDTEPRKWRHLGLS